MLNKYANNVICTMIEGLWDYLCSAILQEELNLLTLVGEPGVAVQIQNVCQIVQTCAQIALTAVNPLSEWGSNKQFETCANQIYLFLTHLKRNCVTKNP